MDFNETFKKIITGCTTVVEQSIVLQVLSEVLSIHVPSQDEQVFFLNNVVQ